MPYPLEERINPPNVENEGVNQTIRLMTALRIELVHSQSARLAARLQPFDSARFVAIVDKIESWLADYIEQATPLDMPESSPEEPLSGPGNSGV